MLYIGSRPLFSGNFGRKTERFTERHITCLLFALEVVSVFYPFKMVIVRFFEKKLLSVSCYPLDKPRKNVLVRHCCPVDSLFRFFGKKRQVIGLFGVRLRRRVIRTVEMVREPGD